MRGLVSALNLFNLSVAYALGLAFSRVIVDPNLTWVFGGPSIIGVVASALVYYLFRYIDKEEYVVSMTDLRDEDVCGNRSIEGVEPYEKTGLHVGEKPPIATSDRY